MVIVHTDLHKWFDKDIKGIKDVLILLHKFVFIEYVLRGLHHKEINGLDAIAIPEVLSNVISDVTSDSFKPKSYSDLSSEEVVKRHHAAIHDLWFSAKRINHLEEPNEELYNAHDVVVREMSHHPSWDELDVPWDNELKSFRVIKDENILHLSHILAGFPDSIELISNIAHISERDVFILPGIDGILHSIISMKMIRDISQAKIVDLRPTKFVESYDLTLIRSSLVDEMEPVFYNNVGFASSYSISSNFVCIVGSIADQTVSLNDVDILVKRGTPDWFFQHIVSLLLLSHPLMNRLHILRDQGLGPTATFVPLYNLFLKKGA